MRIELKGIAISPGVALGKVVLLNRAKMIVERKRIDPSLIEAEKERFLAAVDKSKEQLLSIKEGLDLKDGGRPPSNT
ncbi:MAG: hypothetical protein KatS3mg078_2394 [Deltaproteobacteria bacterium]|nr:MAG: hypothetical protein KatS3mg078_2394 [Deltaproteobacteria bacterium]